MWEYTFLHCWQDAWIYLCLRVSVIPSDIDLYTEFIYLFLSLEVQVLKRRISGDVGDQERK